MLQLTMNNNATIVQLFETIGFGMYVYIRTFTVSK